MTEVYQLIRWFYEVSTGVRSFTHPWRIGAGGAFAFMTAMYKITKGL